LAHQYSKGPIEIGERMQEREDREQKDKEERERRRREEDERKRFRRDEEERKQRIDSEDTGGTGPRDEK